MILGKTHHKAIYVDIGGEVVPHSHEAALKRIMAGSDTSDGTVNASGHRDAGISSLGEDKYFDNFFKDLNQCKAGGGCKGLRFVWGDGMEVLGKGLERLYNGKVWPSDGLVFLLSTLRLIQNCEMLTLVGLLILLDLLQYHYMPRNQDRKIYFDVE